MSQADPHGITADRRTCPSLVVLTWTHEHTCDVKSCYRIPPMYAPLYIPSSLGTSNMTTMRTHLFKDVAKLVTCHVPAQENSIPVNALYSSSVLPVHANVNSKNRSNVHPLVLTLKACKRGDVIATFDPNFPLPDWIVDVACGLRTLTSCSEDCIIHPDITSIVQSTNLFFASPNLGNILPCAEVDVVANVFLRVDPRELWVDSMNCTTMPRVDVVAKVDMRIGDVLVMDHVAFDCKHGHSYVKVLYNVIVFFISTK